MVQWPAQYYSLSLGWWWKRIRVHNGYGDSLSCVMIKRSQGVLRLCPHRAWKIRKGPPEGEQEQIETGCTGVGPVQLQKDRWNLSKKKRREREREREGQMKRMWLMKQCNSEMIRATVYPNDLHYFFCEDNDLHLAWPVKELYGRISWHEQARKRASHSHVPKDFE